MIKIESPTLEQAYKDAAAALECSAAELVIEVVQIPSNGFLGMFKKNAIIVAAKKQRVSQEREPISQDRQKSTVQTRTPKSQKPQKAVLSSVQQSRQQNAQIINDTIMPQSFVSTQEDEDYEIDDINFTADYEDEEEYTSSNVNAYDVASKIEAEINELFEDICFEIDKIEVSAYDKATLLIEFKGKDAALLIGKEGYRYKALSYMIFNWINSKYQLQLRLEIAEFLKNQEESVSRYLVGVCENIDRDGRAQTKILDGVLIQIALKELREKYPDKYVAVRSTRDGLKFIIVNDYHN